MFIVIREYTAYFTNIKFINKLAISVILVYDREYGLINVNEPRLK